MRINQVDNSNDGENRIIMQNKESLIWVITLTAFLPYFFKFLVSHNALQALMLWAQLTLPKDIGKRTWRYYLSIFLILIAYIS